MSVVGPGSGGGLTRAGGRADLGDGGVEVGEGVAGVIDVCDLPDGRRRSPVLLVGPDGRALELLVEVLAGVLEGARSVGVGIACSGRRHYHGGPVGAELGFELVDAGVTPGVGFLEPLGMVGGRLETLGGRRCAGRAGPAW